MRTRERTSVYYYLAAPGSRHKNEQRQAQGGRATGFLPRRESRLLLSHLPSPTPDFTGQPKAQVRRHLQHNRKTLLGKDGRIPLRPKLDMALLSVLTDVIPAEGG